MSSPLDRSPQGVADRLRERLQARQLEESRVAPERQEYRKAASLLTTFDPTTLRTPEDTGAGGAVLQLVDDSTTRGGLTGAEWSLKPEVRDRALRSFTGPDEALRVLEANIDRYPEDSAERIELGFLRRDLPDLETADTDTLCRVREAVGRLSRIPGITGLPSDDDLRIRLEQRRLIEPLERLLRNRFEGRTRELERLRLHVGVLPATSWRGKIVQFGRAKSGQRGDDRPQLPLVVYGPGGIGKSTLIARFLLDHVTALQSDFPFVYVDFERATISIHEPMSMIGEMARQLAALYPRHAELFTALAARCRTIARQRSEEQEETDEWQAIATTRTLGRGVQHHLYVNARDDDARMAAELGMITRIAAKWTPDAQRPFLIVLDSFEEAQYRASPILDRLWALLGALSSTYPDTRVVVAGRAPVGHPEVDVADIPTIELGELDRGAALHFLTTRGVAEPVASALVERVGGSPLSLHLAAAAAHRTGDADGSGDWVDTLPARRRRLFGSVDDMLIQGVLYDRLLHHITNGAVRRLAHPGLVLRRLTPQIIMTVLAPHCGVAVPDLERARELFTEMARELDLVDHVAPEVLQHRPDVRRIMLQLLERDKTAATRAIEHSAVDYYAASDNPADRAEEIYHRLRLGGDQRAVKERWIPEAARYLVDLDGELPTRSARLLDRLRQDVPDDLVVESEQVEWEQDTAVEVENLLAQGFVDHALETMTARRPWTTCSPLYPLLVDALLRADRVDEAQREITEALDNEGVERCGDAYFELLLASAEVARAVGDIAAADTDLLQAERVATSLGREFDALGVMLQRAHLHESVHSPDEDDVDSALARRIESLPDSTLARRPTLVRAIAAEVGRRRPRVLAHAIDLVGLPDGSEWRLRTLADAIVGTVVARPAVTETLRRLGWDSPPADSPTGDATTEQVLSALQDARRAGTLDRVAKELLAIDDDSGRLRDGVATAMSPLAGPADPTTGRPPSTEARER